jgi:UDP-N-acetylglucosamine--N-acetylmuramyl-(pentapeptide) pyrophosphoryl-undecaprenol N-acetylglucosamine transferase
LIPQKGWEFRSISCGKLRRYFSWQNFTDFFRTIAGIFQSLAMVISFRPDVIFCKGGFVSLPVAVAGGLLGRPVVIHESDLEMGLANKLAAHFARMICVSFPETFRKLSGDRRVTLTGNPVRRELAQGKPEAAYKFTGLKPGRPTILVMGGSQGSQFLNSLIISNLSKLLNKYQIVHVCGKGNLTENLPFGPDDGYFALEYLAEEQKDVLSITDLFIGRAGANSLAELDFLELPAILIPLIQGSRGDQIKNADSFVRDHRAIILDERKIDLDKLDLLKEIDNVLGREEHTGGKKNSSAAQKIADLLIRLTDQNDKKSKNRS